MKILVCVKQVPEGLDLPLDAERHTLRRDKGRRVVNPADCAALEQAFRLKERHGGEVTVASMGPAEAEAMLREIAPLPADRLVLLTDPAFAGSDGLTTAGVLAAAAAYLGGFDVILAGRRAVDGETGHVGPEIAALLGVRSCVTNATGDLRVEGGVLHCARLLEDRLLPVAAPLPAVATLCGGAHALRPPGIQGLRDAGKKTVERLGNRELGLDPGSVGLDGSPTRVAAVRRPAAAERQRRLYRDVDEGVGALVRLLRESTAAERYALSSSVQTDQQSFLPRPPEGGEGRGEGVHEQGDSPVKKRIPVGPTPPLPNPLPLPGGEGENLAEMTGQGDTVAWIVSIDGDEHGARAAGELFGQAMAMGARPRLVVVRGGDDAACALALADRARAERPDIVLLPASIRGRAVAPYAAAVLRTGLTADCTELRLDDCGALIQVRPAFGGSLLAEIHCRTRPQMATVRPGVFPPGNIDGAETLVVDAGPGTVAYGEAAPVAVADLTQSDIIVAGGRGVGRDGFRLLEELAARLGAGVGASRAAVDAGFAPYARQIGQTGVTVRPRLYLAFGVSGTAQHVAGMRDSGRVFAVNRDAGAAIFDHADVGIVADWREAATRLMHMVESFSGGQR